MHTTTTRSSLSEHLDHRLTRRSALKYGAVLGVSVPALSTLIAACADTDDDDDEGLDDGDDGIAAPDEDDTEDLADDSADEEDDDEAAEPSGGGTARVVMPNMSSDPATMNPLFGGSGAEHSLGWLHFGGLLKVNAEQQVEPDLAENFELSDDGLEYTFHIVEDANWSDGEPVTANDVLFTIQTAINPETGSRHGSGGLGFLTGVDDFRNGDTDSIAGLSSPDEKTLVIELDQPNPIMPLQLHIINGLGILPEHIYGEIEPSELEGHPLSQSPEVGAGAFLLSRWEPDQFLEFTANEDYHRGRPLLDSIIFILLDLDVAIAELETGTIELTDVPFDELNRTEQLDGVEILSGVSTGFTRLRVQNNKEYLSLPVRQAMMYAIDHEGIINAAYAGLAEPRYAHVFGPEDFMGDVVAEAGLNTYDYDPDRARELLEEADWDPNQTVELIYATNAATEVAAWTMIQSNLQDVGIEVQLRQVEEAAYRQITDDGEFDLIVQRGGSLGADPGLDMWEVAIPLVPATTRPDGELNVIRYTNEELNAIIRENEQIVDLDARRENFLEIARIINEEVPTIFLWTPYNNFGVRDTLRGFQPPGHPSNIAWNADEWSIES